MRKILIPFIVVLFTQAVVNPVFGQAPAMQDVELIKKEIKRIRKELLQVQNERLRVKESVKADRADFDEYRTKALSKMRDMRSESDTLKMELDAQKLKRDSLTGAYMAIKSKEKQFDLQQDNFRSIVLENTERLLAEAEKLSPSIREKPVSALKLLKNELSTRSVDNIEAVTRLFQVARDIDNAGSNIQIVQGTSPIEEIRGTTYRLRVGTLFEAVVNTEGSMAALWKGFDDQGNDNWEMLKDPIVAGEILNAINVREGKSLPSLVKLPFEDAVVLEKESM